ncbi:MAG: fimbrillin family protein, partial [Firmicutes bacterium]|nr:fimbrillin family protein [Bacillota bacterium]
MKNILYRLLTALFLLSCFLVSCSDYTGKDNEIIELGEGEIHVEGSNASRAADSDWQSGDAIGITMYDENYTQPVNGVYISQYVTTAPDLGTLTPATRDETIY